MVYKLSKYTFFHKKPKCIVCINLYTRTIFGITEENYLLLLSCKENLLELMHIHPEFFRLMYKLKVIILNKSLASSNIRTKAGGLYYLAELTKLQGDLKTALAMQEEYEILRDSIQQQTYTETIQQQQALYNYQQIEEEATTYKLHHIASQRNNFLLSLLLSFVVLIVTLSLFVQLNYKKEKEKQLEQERILQNQQHRSSLSEKEKFISQLEDTFSSEKEEMNMKLLMLKRRIVDIQKQKSFLLGVKEQYAESIPFWDSIRKGQKLTDDEWQIFAT